MFQREYLTQSASGFRAYKQLADRALAQVDDDALFVALDEESNSLAVIMKHMAGNMRSRWTDFLTTDGEKPDRARDTEFVVDGDSRESIVAAWEAGWSTVFDAVEALTVEDLDATVTIRGEPHTVSKAIDRQLLHYAYHVGQIVLLARHAAGPRWTSLSVPRGRSQAYNAEMRDTHGEWTEGKS